MCALYLLITNVPLLHLDGNEGNEGNEGDEGDEGDEGNGRFEIRMKICIKI